MIDSTGRVLLTRDLGHYDCFNHYLRIDGADDLYFLRGTPPESHERKVLCRIDRAGAVRECSPWDPEAAHLTGSTAGLLPDGTLVRAYKSYDPKPSAFAGYIDALEMPAGTRRWRRAIPALVTALAGVEGHPWLLYALTDGRVGIIDARTGDLLHEQSLRFDGVNTVVLSLAVRGDRVVCGTLDGRIVVLRMEESG